MKRVKILLTFKDGFGNPEALHVDSDEFGVLHYRLATGYGHGGVALAVSNLGPKVTACLPHTTEDFDAATIASSIRAILMATNVEAAIRYARDAA